MIFRRLVLSLVLLLFATVTVGVVVGLDDAARRDLAGRFPPSDPYASPAEPTPSSVPPTRTPPTSTPSTAARPRPTATARPGPSVPPTRAPQPKPTPTATPSATKPPTIKPSAKPTTAPTAKPGTKHTDRYLTGPLRKGPGGTVYLTFDDGPGPATASILAILSRTGSTATFFHLGVNEPAYPHADDRIRAQGSKVGNHTYNHPDLTMLTAKQLRWQLAHGPRATCFRPPYGATNTAVRRAVERAGLRQVLWDVDTLDWTKPGVGTLAKTGRLKSVRSGSVVLLHDGGGDRSQTVAALPTIIRDLQARGFRVRALPGC